MLQKLNNYSFQTDFYEILRDMNSLDNMKVMLIDGEPRLEYKKSNTEKTSYLYKNLESANSDFLQFKIFHNLYYKFQRNEFIG